jgi:hypothetical protein
LYARGYEQWAACNEIAYRFRHETLQEAQRITAGPLIGSWEDEEKRWRDKMAEVTNTMRANGSDVSGFMETQLAALEDHDTYSGDDAARIRNSMLATCQNLLTERVSQAPPPRPTPPKPDA